MRRVEEHLVLTPFDGWPDEMPSQNARGDLAGSLALRRFGDGPLFQRLRALAPAGARQAVKRLLSRRAEAPEVTDAEIAQFLFSDSWDGDARGGAQFGSFKLYKDEFLAANTPEVFWRTPMGGNNLAFFDTSDRDATGWDATETDWCK